MEILLQQIINGLVLGSMYALVALGYTMVYGIINLINFAHGEVLMVGALTSWAIITTAQEAMPGIPGWLLLVVALVISCVVAAALNFTIEKVAYRPLRNSPKLAPLHVSMNPAHPGYDGKPIEWVRVHKAPDYVYFNHSAHVNRGISCQSCHGNVDKMDVVFQAESHSMGWCLACHRTPEAHLRPLEEVYHFNYCDEDAKKYAADGSVDTTKDLGKKLKETFNVHPKTSCTTCHR